MIVALHFPHNEGVTIALVDGPGFDSTGHGLVDAYEVDASLKSFATEEEVEAWLAEEHGDDPSDPYDPEEHDEMDAPITLADFKVVPGGRIYERSY